MTAYEILTQTYTLVFQNKWGILQVNTSIHHRHANAFVTEAAVV